MCCWIHILAWISRSCIVIYKLLVLDGSLHYVQCVPYAAIRQIFLLFRMIWYCRIKSPAVSKEQDMQWCCFRWSIPLSIDYVWNSSIDCAISTPSCSYCIWSRWCQNHSKHSAEFPIVCIIWYGWIQSSAMFKEQDVRWCGYRWSIQISIDLCLKCVYW